MPPQEPASPAPSAPRDSAPVLRELALLFLRLGTTAFGGPAAHIALMEDEVVRRRRWLTREEFVDLLGAANLIPGPNSTELAIHIGHRRGGWPGLLVSGVCFILPAFLIVTGFAWAYARFGDLPDVGALLYGVKAVIIAVVLQALWGLSRTVVKTRLAAVVAVGSAAAAFLGVNELWLLLLSGLGVLAWRAIEHRREHGPSGRSASLPVSPWALALPLGAATTAVPFTQQGLFLFFLKVGSVLYGSGYVLLAFLRSELVERWGWLTQAQLLDAVAVGQVTPGPVFTTATFIGYVLGGMTGAVVATVGIFLPAFFFVALSGPLVPRLRRSWRAGAFLDGVNVASLALMAVVTWQLGRAALVDAWTVGLALASAVLLIRWRVNSAWLVLGGGAVGWLVKSLSAG
ncbi:chromate efflux transporter [Myxococcus sp. CA051A]|uniref:chromate efflux transporter n=1 Tax=unclassified Myxococcus TaxID=2648731 RepID=UPI00157A4F38|nr:MULTISPECIES: chromate efflux transporter [unclassified Myxococcus]NTX34041.1 chromate efflux transporter [Myxococcus sp. CA033]NTX65772.1 chromate efflux transporter [Myxococcus sp. CA051A]